MPWRVASYRIISRHIKATLAGNNRWPGWRRLYSFWRWSGRYYGNQNASGLNEWGVPETKRTAASLLAPYADKLTVCRSNREIEALLVRGFSFRSDHV